MAEIRIERDGASDGRSRFRVVVREGDSSTEHDVTASDHELGRLGSGYPTAEAFVEACFDFLLQREPKEAILPAFDVGVIGGYFPEFERSIARDG